jgi:hypothetical protein
VSVFANAKYDDGNHGWPLPSRNIFQLLVGEFLAILVVVPLVVVSHVRPLSWVGVEPCIRFLSRIGQKKYDYQADPFVTASGTI